MRRQTRAVHSTITLWALAVAAALIILYLAALGTPGGSKLLQLQPHPAGGGRGITWVTPLSLSETGGRTDVVSFGEATDAWDGPPADPYDVAKPPSPITPYLRGWFSDNIPSPYDLLWTDFRSSPDVAKTWNLTVQWVPTTFVPTTVTIAWDTSLINASEYDQVFLRNTIDILADMRTANSYTFACPPFVPQDFTIVCTADTTPPHITNHSPASGHTGDSYTFATTITDDLTASSQLTASVNWAHGSLSGNTTLTNIGGDEFTATITLDNYSTSDLTYRLYARDTAKTPNVNYTTPYTATVIDDEPPVVSSCSGPMSVGTADSITLWVKGTDNIGITAATATIDTMGHAMSWNSGLLRWEYAYTAPSSSIASHSYALSVSDAAANSASTGPYTITVFDNDPPEITSDSGSVSVGTGDPIILWVKATDNIDVTAAKATIDTVDHAMTWNSGLLQWEYTYTAPTGNTAPHYYTITVSDAALNTLTHGSYTITVTDNDAPVISANSGSTSVGTADSIILWVQAADNIGVANAKATIDTVDHSMIWNPGASRWEYSYTAPADSTASHTYTMTVSDAAANAVSTGSYTITVFDNDPPEIMSDSGSVSVGTGDSVTLWVQTTDNIGVTTAKATIDAVDHAMTYNSGLSRWEYLYTAPSASVASHSYSVTVKDSALNARSNGPYTITVVDNDPPVIISVVATPSSQLMNQWVNISATITENINLLEYRVRIDGPAGFTPVNVSLNPWLGNAYYYNATYSLTGTYNYSIWAKDTSANGASSTVHQFTIYDELEITVVRTGWNIISLSFNQTITKADLFVIYGGQRYTWSQAAAQSIVMDTLYSWSRDTQGYGLAYTLTPGSGYWLYSYHDCQIWATNLAPMVYTNYITALKGHWNIIGVPCSQPLNKTTLLVTYLGVDYNWTQATTSANPTGQPLIVKDIFGWKRIAPQGYLLSEVLDPGAGYWIYAYQNCVLRRPL